MQAYTIEQAANVIGVDTRTLRRYDERGTFIALRHASGRMYYTYDMLQDYLRGAYNPKDIEKYSVLPKAPISIFVNTKSLHVLTQANSGRTVYYQLPQSDEYYSEFNILCVERPERPTATIVTYSVGKFKEKWEENPVFIPAFSWKSLEF